MFMFQYFREALEEAGYNYYRTQEERPIITDMKGNHIEEFKGQYDGKGKGELYHFALGPKRTIHRGVEMPDLTLITDFVHSHFFNKESKLDSLIMQDCFVLAAQGMLHSNKGEMNIDALRETDPILYSSAEKLAEIAGKNRARVAIKRKYRSIGEGFEGDAVREGRFYTYLKKPGKWEFQKAIFAVADAFVLFDGFIKHQARLGIIDFMQDENNKRYNSLVMFDPEKSFE